MTAPCTASSKTAFSPKASLYEDCQSSCIAVKVVNHLGDKVMKVFKVK